MNKKDHVFYDFVDSQVKKRAQRPITVLPQVKWLFGDWATALVVSQAVAWQGWVETVKKRTRWGKSYEEWCEELGYGRSQVARGLKRMKSLGLILTWKPSAYGHMQHVCNRELLVLLLAATNESFVAKEPAPSDEEMLTMLYGESGFPGLDRNDQEGSKMELLALAVERLDLSREWDFLFTGEFLGQLRSESAAVAAEASSSDGPMPIVRPTGPHSPAHRTLIPYTPIDKSNRHSPRPSGTGQAASTSARPVRPTPDDQDPTFSEKDTCNDEVYVIHDIGEAPVTRSTRGSLGKRRVAGAAGSEPEQRSGPVPRAARPGKRPGRRTPRKSPGEVFGGGACSEAGAGLRKSLSEAAAERTARDVRRAAALEAKAPKRKRRKKDPMQASIEADLKANRAAFGKELLVDEEAEVTRPGSGASFEELAHWSASKFRYPRSRGRGIKSIEDWTGPDFDCYIADLTESFLGAPRPESTVKAKSQAKRLLTSVQDREGLKDLVDYVFKNFENLCNRLRWSSRYPSAALLEGYLETLRDAKAGTLKKDVRAENDVARSLTGAHRGHSEAAAAEGERNNAEILRRLGLGKENTGG